MTPFLLILAVFAQFHDIAGILPGVLSPEPFRKAICDKDAFISSNPINGKVFLSPAKKADRSNMDWYENRAYCADNCAEMITVKSVGEHTLLNEFFKHLQYANVWQGGQIVNQTKFSNFSNGEDATVYHPKSSAEYNEVVPLACSTLWNLNTNFFWGLWCYSVQGVGCQRRADWTACE